MARLSTHILDLGLGKPAPNIPVRLSFLTGQNRWEEFGGETTDKDGRIQNILPTGMALQLGRYKLKFVLSDYFRNTYLTEPFYPEIEIQFALQKLEEHYHIPLLLNQYGYSTYRGS